MAKKLGEVLTGTAVKIRENGIFYDYIVVQQGTPSDDYSGAENASFVLRKDILSIRRMSGSSVTYIESEMNAFLNDSSSGFLSLLDGDIRDAILSIDIPYRSSFNSSNINQMSCKVFLMSFIEYEGRFPEYIIEEGVPFAYFVESSDSKKIAKYEGTPIKYWTRSLSSRPNTSGYYYGYVSETGATSDDWVHNADSVLGCRPIFALPQTLYINDNGEVITNLPPTAPGSIDVSGVVSGGEATITLTEATDPDGTIANYVYERSVDGGEFVAFSTVNSLTQTDQIDESWGTVAYRACAIDDAGVSGPYITSETEVVNSGWLLIGGPASNLGVKGNKFDFKVTIGVSGESSVTDIAVTIKLDGKLIYDDVVDQDETITQSIDTRTFGSGQHDIQVVASKEDYFSAAAAYVFTVPSMALPDGGYSAIAQDSNGNPVFYVTTGRNVIGANGMSLQAEVDQINKSHRGTTGHLEFIDSILGPESDYELVREENVTYAAQLFAPANSTSSMSLACIYAGYTGTIGNFLTVEAEKLKPTVPANSILSLYKYVLDTLPDAETDPTVNFVAIEQPKVLSAATNTGVTATDLNDALKQMMSEFPTQNYYAVTDTTGDITYYIVSQAKITEDTTTVNCAYVASNAPNKWYRGVDVEFFNQDWAPSKESLTLGNTISWAGQNWIVANVDSTECYLTLASNYGTSVFDADGSAVYAGSDLANTAMNFQTQQLTATQLLCLKDVEVNGVTAKVFVASYEQMNGGFEYFNEDLRRKIGTDYWTSTLYNSSSAWFIYSDGSIGNNYTGNSRGFRPSVCLDLTLLG